MVNGFPMTLFRARKVRESMSDKKSDFLDVAVYGSAVILYVKTAEVLSYFAPQSISDIVGFDISGLYGNISAIFVEGVAIYLHKKNANSAMASFVKWFLIGISGLCQVFDGFIVTETLVHQSETIKFLFQFGVPLIPLMLVVLIFAIGELPSNNERIPFRGVKHWVDQIPKIWYGESYVPKTPNKKQEDKPKTNPQIPPR